MEASLYDTKHHSPWYTHIPINRLFCFLFFSFKLLFSPTYICCEELERIISQNINCLSLFFFGFLMIYRLSWRAWMDCCSKCLCHGLGNVTTYLDEHGYEKGLCTMRNYVCVASLFCHVLTRLWIMLVVSIEQKIEHIPIFWVDCMCLVVRYIHVCTWMYNEEKWQQYCGFCALGWWLRVCVRCVWLHSVVGDLCNRYPCMYVYIYIRGGVQVSRVNWLSVYVGIYGIEAWDTAEHCTYYSEGDGYVHVRPYPWSIPPSPFEHCAHRPQQWMEAVPPKSNTRPTRTQWKYFSGQNTCIPPQRHSTPRLIYLHINQSTYLCTNPRFSLRPLPCTLSVAYTPSVAIAIST